MLIVQIAKFGVLFEETFEIIAHLLLKLVNSHRIASTRRIYVVGDHSR